MSERARRRLAWVLLVLSLGGLLVAALWRAVDPAPTTAVLGASSGPVVVVGVPGLTYDEISRGAHRSWRTCHHAHRQRWWCGGSTASPARPRDG